MEKRQSKQIDGQEKIYVESIGVLDEGHSSNPFTHVTYWDFIIVIVFIALRFLVVTSIKIKELEKDGKEFNSKAYFDMKHIIRWSLHVLSAFAGLLILPELFIHYIQPKYFSGLEIWTLFGSAIIGYLGYDIVKWAEKIAFKLYPKLNPNS